MKLSRQSTGLIAGALATAIAIATIAPAAQAGHGSGPGHYKTRAYSGYSGRSGISGYQPRVVRYDNGYSSRRVVIREGSSALPLLAGFIGGLVVGSSIHSAPPPESYCSPPPPDTYYYDPYCHERFATLDGYRHHLYRFHHPEVIRVIEVRSGRCVDSYSYDSGRWEEGDRYGDSGEYDGQDSYGSDDEDN